jgi:regulator of RNase E activity RraA
VSPGDLVVADGDGVVVVPAELIVDVAKWASREMVSDRAARRKMYIELGMELDDSV